MRHEEIRSRWNALSLCHHWFGGADKAARCWTVASTQASAPLAAPQQPPKHHWEHSLWPHLQLMKLFLWIRQDVPLSEDFRIKSLTPFSQEYSAIFNNWEFLLFFSVRVFASKETIGSHPSVERKALLGRLIARDCCKQAEVAGWYNDTVWSFFISNSLSHRRNEACLFRWSAHNGIDGITVCKKRCWIECIIQKWRIRWCRGGFLGVERLISPVRDGCSTVTVCPLLLPLTVKIQVSTLNVCDRCGVTWCGWPGCERSIFMLTNCQHILVLM